MRYDILITVLFLIGCKASPAPDAGFIDQPEQMVDASDKTPFHRGWASDYWRNNRLRYDKIIIAPVNTDYLVKADWWQRQNSQTQHQLDVGRQTLAHYMHEKVINAFKKDPNKRFTVVQEPGSNTALLEIAIVELTPAKVFFNAAGTISTLFVPGGSLVTGATGKGTVAIEVRVKDSQTQVVHAKFADREKDKMAPINFAQYTWHQGSKQNISDWARQFVEVSNLEPGKRVKDSRPFTLKPW